MGALARIKTWITGEALTAATLNAEFNNILDNPATLVSGANVSLGTVAASGTIAAAGAVTVAGTLTANGNVVLNDNPADALTIAASSVTWGAGAVAHSGTSHTFSGPLVATGFRSRGPTVLAVPNNTATSVVTLANGDAFLVRGWFADDNMHGSVIVQKAGFGAVITMNDVSSPDMVFTATGDDLQVTQTTGSEANFTWTAMQLA